MANRYTHAVKQMALHYRVQRVAADHGWDCTVGDIADELDLPITTVSNVCRAKGWLTRLRSMKADHSAHYLVEDHLGAEAA